MCIRDRILRAFFARSPAGNTVSFCYYLLGGDTATSCWLLARLCQIVTHFWLLNIPSIFGYYVYAYTAFQLVERSIVMSESVCRSVCVCSRAYQHCNGMSKLHKIFHVRLLTGRCSTSCRPTSSFMDDVMLIQRFSLETLGLFLRTPRGQKGGLGLVTFVDFSVLKNGGRPPCWICLLYTSPSPRDRQKSRMPSSA